MLNLTFSLALADVPFHFIPKIIFEHKENGQFFLSIFWFTLFFQINNDQSVRTGKDVYYQYVYTVLCDSFTKSSEIMEIINENDRFDVFFEKINEYLDQRKLGSQEKDEDGFHIVCDEPGMSRWEEEELKERIKQELIKAKKREE